MSHHGQGFVLGSATLDDGGHLTASPVYHGAHETRRQVDSNDLAAIESAIEELHLTGPPNPAPTGPGCCDRGYSTLVVTIEGRAYPLPPQGRLNALMWTLQRDAVRGADEEYWLKAAPFNPGKAWTVTLKECWASARSKDGPSPGRWVNEGKPNAFSGVFRKPGTKQPVHDTVTVDSVTGEHIILTRQGTNAHYYGRWNPDRPDEFMFWGVFEHPADPQETPDGCTFLAEISR